MDFLPQVLDPPVDEECITEGQVDDFLIHRDDDETQEHQQPCEAEQEPEPEPDPPATMEQIFDGVPKLRKINGKEKKPRKKRVLTEAHKEKLKLAREKALITRRKNAAKRKELKEIEAKIEENKLNDKRREAGMPIPPREQDKKIEQVVEQIKSVSFKVEEEEEVMDNSHSTMAKMYNMSAEQIEELQLNAIAQYETIRMTKEKKKRIADEKKRASEERTRQSERVKEELREIITPSQVKKYGKEGYWDDYF